MRPPRRLGLAFTLAAAAVGCGPAPGAQSAAPDGRPSTQDSTEDARADVRDARLEAAAPDAVAAETPAEVAPAGEDWAAFTAAFAPLYCRRIFSCCKKDERFTGSDDEPTCVKREAAVVLSVGTDFIDGGHSRYDRDAASACLRDLTAGSCGQVFSRENGGFVACQDVLVGLRADGLGCDDDLECASGRCTGAQCVPAAPPPCSPTQFVDATTSACRPRGVVDTACRSRAECAPSLTCAAGLCGAPLPNGAPCARAEECAGTCSTLSGDSVGVCRPGICQGA